MKLNTYLSTEGLTLAQFGEQIGRTAATVSRIARGLHVPDWQTIRAIHEATNGQVAPNDWLDEGE